MKLQFFLYVIILGLCLNLLSNMIWKYLPASDIHIDKIVTSILVSTCIILLILHRKENKDLSRDQTLDQLWEEFNKKFSILFSLIGLRTDVLPGIRISVIPVFLSLEYFRWELLAQIGWYDLSPFLIHLLVVVFSMLGGVICWFVSGWIFDPLYDWLYGPDKPFTKRGQHLIIFPQGYSLNAHRKSARTKIADKNKGNPAYQDEENPIYDSILAVLSKHNVSELDSIMSHLQNSKTLRNAILPLLVLVVVAIYSGEYWMSAILLSVSILLFAASASFRVKHTERMYQVYCHPDVPTL